MPYAPPQRTTCGIWDDATNAANAVIAKAKMCFKRPIGRVVVAQVAPRIQVHFARKETQSWRPSRRIWREEIFLVCAIGRAALDAMMARKTRQRMVMGRRKMRKLRRKAYRKGLH